VTRALTVPGLVVVPMVVGLLAGLVCGRLAARWRRLGTACVAITLLLAPSLPAVVGSGPIRLGVWDMVTLAALALLGRWLARPAAGPGLGRRLRYGIVVTVVTLGGLELGTRALLAPFPRAAAALPAR
jgi:hypothetical protein